MIRDKMIEEIHRVRRELATELGGVDGMFKYFQALDRERLQKEGARAKRKRKVPIENIANKVAGKTTRVAKAKTPVPSPRKRTAARVRGK